MYDPDSNGEPGRDPSGAGRAASASTTQGEMSEDPGPGAGPHLEADELAAAVNRSADAVSVLDEEFRHLYANEAYADLLGYEGPDALVGEPMDFFLSGEELEMLRQEALDVLRQGEPWRGDLLLHRRDGTPVSQELSLTPLEEGRVVCVARRPGEHGDLQERLERLAYYDPLTDLANRRLLEEKARQALAMARRSGESVALIYLDLNDFKAVNDNLGHALGDEVLAQVAERLDASVREADTAARVGGDEFAVLLGEVEGEAAAVLVAQRILAALEDPLKVDDHSLELGSSIGMSFFPRYASSFEELMRQADLAMYGAGRAKEVGIRIFRPDHGIQTPRHARLVDELHDALEHYRFALHYQPVRKLVNDRVVGAQALVRWPHPRLGTLAAAKFVPLVEEAGLVRRLDRWVLASAALQLRAWSEAGFDGWMAVHLSDRTCDDPQLTDYLERALVAARPVDPERLVVQLPAHRALREDSGFGELVGALRERGVSVAVDAFEADTASTAYLRDVPPELLYLGPTMLGTTRNGDRRKEMVRTIVDLAHSVGTRVLAKGVERGTQIQWLQELGCDYAQGYLVGWSVPPEAFLDEVEEVGRRDGETGRPRAPEGGGAGDRAEEAVQREPEPGGGGGGPRDGESRSRLAPRDDREEERPPRRARRPRNRNGESGHPPGRGPGGR